MVREKVYDFNNIDRAARNRANTEKMRSSESKVSFQAGTRQAFYFEEGRTIRAKEYIDGDWDGIVDNIEKLIEERGNNY
jgi:hypothetical protein